MEVLLLADKLNVRKGGSNFSLDLMSETLAERGHDVTVVTLNFVHDENVLPDETSYEVVEDPIEGGSKPQRALQVYRKLPEYDGSADVLHVFNPAIHPIVGHYRSRAGETPVVGRLNNYDMFCTNLSVLADGCYEHCTTRKKFRHSDAAVGQKLSRLPKYVYDTFVTPGAMSQLDMLFAVSPAVKEIYGALGVDEDMIEVVPNFYDPTFAGADVDGRDAEGFSVLSVGRLKPEKGVDVLIESVARLDDDIGCTVDVVGRGSQMGELQGLAAELGVADTVTFHGHVDHGELPAFYEAADIFALPGRWPEPFSRTLLEAMQYGCPLVVSDVGGSPWAVEGCGLLFDRGDADMLADRIATVARDEDRQRELVEGCEGALARFEPEAVVAQIEERYERLVVG